MFAGLDYVGLVDSQGLGRSDPGLTEISQTPWGVGWSCGLLGSCWSDLTVTKQGTQMWIQTGGKR